MKILNKIIAISMLIAMYIPITSYAADTNTVSSTVSSSNTVTGTTTVDKTPPTANAHDPPINPRIPAIIPNTNAATFIRSPSYF